MYTQRIKEYLQRADKHDMSSFVYSAQARGLFNCLQKRKKAFCCRFSFFILYKSKKD